MAEKKRDETADSSIVDKTSDKKKTLSKHFKKILLLLSLVFLLFASYVGYLYSSTPEVIRKPLLEHYHFRMQIIMNGQPENFGDEKYQAAYAKDQCNADLPAHPIHFHDGKDQFAHIHWEGMTGGIMMKYYGWNYIGGPDDILGYRVDKLPNPDKVPIHGKVLPVIPNDTNFYIYTGDKNNYQKRNFEDWKTQDLERFFGKTSNSPAHELNKKKSFLDNIFPEVYAHDGVIHEPTAASHESEEEKLTRINNLIGDVIIFVQKNEPSVQEIKERFSNLQPLSESTCGG